MTSEQGRKEMMRLLAASAGLGPEEADGLAERGPRAMLEAIAARSADPRAQAMVRAFGELETAPLEEPSGRTEPTSDDNRIHRELQVLRRRIALVERHFHGALEFIAGVASVLGACAVCFGLDERCAHCRGRGSPGAYATEDPQLLHDWLETLTRRLQPHTHN